MKNCLSSMLAFAVVCLWTGSRAYAQVIMHY